MQKISISNLEEMDFNKLTELRTHDFQEKEVEYMVKAYAFLKKLIKDLQDKNIPKCSTKNLNQLKLIKLYLKRKISIA